MADTPKRQAARAGVRRRRPRGGTAALLEHLAGALRFYEEVQADASGDRDHELEEQTLISRETASSGMTATPQLHQFKLVLVGVEPPIWRRIQPDRFDPNRVKFDDPARRYKLAFEAPRAPAPRGRRTTKPRRKRSRSNTR